MFLCKAKPTRRFLTERGADAVIETGEVSVEVMDGATLSNAENSELGATKVPPSKASGCDQIVTST